MAGGGLGSTPRGTVDPVVEEMEIILAPGTDVTVPMVSVNNGRW